MIEHPELARTAAVIGAFGVAAVLLGRRRALFVAGLALLAAAEAGLVLSLPGSLPGTVVSVGGAVAGLAAAALLVGAAAVLVRRPWLVAPAVLVAAPLRPPLDFDSSSTFLISIAHDGRLGRLLPLYFVLAAGALALGWSVARGRPDTVPALPASIARPAAAFLAWACLSLLWATDPEAGANLLVFFTLPFALLLATVPRTPFPDWAPRALGIVAVGLGVVFALFGLWQAVTKQVFFFDPGLAVTNANNDYFRVTSLFSDPSLYGRHVVAAMGILLAVLVAGRLRPWVGIALLALLWAGLLFSFSQSSMVALVVVTLAVAAAAGDRRTRRATIAATLSLAMVLVAFVGVKLEQGASLNRLTSDRTERMQYTLTVIADRPIAGVGIGGQPRATRIAAKSSSPTPGFVSHNTPLTVVAELGAIGLVLYAWLLVGGARAIAAVHRHNIALGLALGAIFLALFVHALFYSGFLEDPITWIVLAVAAARLASATAAERARERRQARRGEATA